MKLSARPPRPVWKRYLLDGRPQALAIIAIAIGLTVFLARFAISGKESGSFQCAPDGSLLLPDQTVAPAWEAKYFFSITIAWGRFDLSTAKLIDIAWDIIVGRGGQLGLSLMAFRTIRRSMLSSLEHESWHIPVLTRLILDPVSLLSLWAAFKDRCKRGPKMLFAYGLLVMYVLLFSTISSAMTGYRAEMSPYYPQDEGSTLPLVDSKLAQLFPLELTNVTGTEGNGCGVSMTPENQCLSKAFPGCVTPPVGDCYTSWLLYADLYTQCTKSSEHGTWAGTNYDLPMTADTTLCTYYDVDSPPICNKAGGSVDSSGTTHITLTNDRIEGVVDSGTCNTTTLSGETSISIGWTAYSDDKFYLTTTNISIGDVTYRLAKEPVDVRSWNVTDYRSRGPGADSPRYYNDTTGKVWNSTWLRANVICQPEKTYQWGFSSLLLFTQLTYTIVYGIVLLILVRENSSSELVRHCDIPDNIYRDILDLAAEIRNEVGDDVEDVEVEQLEKRIHTRTGKVRLVARRDTKATGSEQGLKTPFLRDAAVVHRDHAVTDTLSHWG